MTEKPNVYGQNHPKEEDKKKEPGIREEVTDNDDDKSVAEELEETRQQMAQEGQRGGMGRESTPSTEESQGTYNRPNDPTE